jgi:hypothetical protein
MNKLRERYKKVYGLSGHYTDDFDHIYSTDEYVEWLEDFANSLLDAVDSLVATKVKLEFQLTQCRDEQEGSMKHTPGPWTVSIDRFYDRPEVRDKDGRRIAVVVYDFPMGPKTADKNANLIAAAPDLLEAFEDLLDAIERGDYTGTEYHKACDAIAKAKGERV